MRGTTNPEDQGQWRSVSVAQTWNYDREKNPDGPVLETVTTRIDNEGRRHVSRTKQIVGQEGKQPLESYTSTDDAGSLNAIFDQGIASMRPVVEVLNSDGPLPINNVQRYPHPTSL